MKFSLITMLFFIFIFSGCNVGGDVSNNYIGVRNPIVSDGCCYQHLQFPIVVGTREDPVLCHCNRVELSGSTGPVAPGPITTPITPTVDKKDIPPAAK
ncbi:MAG: hypothetical protein AABY32_04210 [Nanoarchaeota archaeon]